MAIVGSSEHSKSEAPTVLARYHHVGIQTLDLTNSMRWYSALFEGQITFDLKRFSELTTDRLPGISRLVEVTAGDLRIHLFLRNGAPAPDPRHSRVQFQHVALQVLRGRDLEVLRERCIRLLHSGDYNFAIEEEPTPIVLDDDGVSSFYAYDVNGLEFEFTHVPKFHG